MINPYDRFENKNFCFTRNCGFHTSLTRITLVVIFALKFVGSGHCQRWIRYTTEDPNPIRLHFRVQRCNKLQRSGYMLRIVCFWNVKSIRALGLNREQSTIRLRVKMATLSGPPNFSFQTDRGSSFLGSSLRTVRPCNVDGRCSNLMGGVSVRASKLNERKTRIQKVIEEDGIVLMPGCYDALSAVIVQNIGFRAGFISGYALSASLLGKPDFGLLTPPEMATSARFICAAAPLIPIIADADTGGGNALNVQRTVRDLIAAGAAGCFLEDQAWPKKCGHMRGKQVIPAEEHAAKIAAARDAIGESDFFLVARTDARATSAKSGLADAIARANLYTEAGAHASFVEAPRDDDELKEIGQQTKGYRVCNMLEGGVTPLHTAEELKGMGFHLIVHPLTTLYASSRALIDILKSLKMKGTTRDHLDKLATFEEFNKLVSLESWFELEARYAQLKNNITVKS